MSTTQSVDMTAWHDNSKTTLFNPEKPLLINGGWTIKSYNPSYRISPCEGLTVDFMEPHKMPNRFNRWMQCLFFGFKYEKL